MYERFTDRARKIMSLANQEALRFNHDYIGTEHILLAIAKEGSGVGANVLKQFGAELRNIRVEVEKLCPSGPDFVLMSKLPHNNECRDSLEKAIEFSKEMGDNHIGTEHLVAGVYGNPEWKSSQILKILNISREDIEVEVKRILGKYVESDRRNLHNQMFDAFMQSMEYSSKQNHIRFIFDENENPYELFKAKFMEVLEKFATDSE